MYPTNDADSDLLRPSFSQSFRVSAYSQVLWSSLLASAQCSNRLPDSCSEIRTLLNNTPSIPSASEVPDSAEGNLLVLEGHSQWSVSPRDKSTNDECDLSANKEAYPRRAYIGVTRPSICQLSEEYVPGWLGFQSLPQSSGNYLCVCVLAWSYIFSARLIELRKVTPDDRVTYTDIMAQWSTKDGSSSTDIFELPLGNVEPAEARWWAAILAAGNGWCATLKRDNKEYSPPWRCHLANNSILLRSCAEISSSSFRNSGPPSSAEAQAYLFNFARLYDCFDQLLAAFLAAITIPSHNRFGAAVVLPRPVQCAVSQQQSTELSYAQKLPISSEIPHFMALSCITNVISSSLSGSFWEPGITCNLASEWLNPPLKDILPSLIRQKDYHAVLCAMSYRRPRLASLWLGATLSGLLPRIIQVCRSYLPPTSLEAVVWTGSPQSFLDPEYCPKDTVISGKISREDEIRLLYLTDTQSEVYGLPPLSSYPPFGFVKLKDTSLDVRLHVNCHHKLRYVSWVWKRGSGEGLNDYGLCGQSQTPPKPQSSSLGKKCAAVGLLVAAYSMKSMNSRFHLSKFLELRSWKLFPGACVLVYLLNCLAVNSSTRHACRVWSTLSAVFSAVLSVARSLPWLWKRTSFDDSLSESATRNTFSWMFFPDGTRLDERRLWEHEWLSFLRFRDYDDAPLPASSSSSDDEQAHDGDSGYILKWLEGIHGSPE